MKALCTCKAHLDWLCSASQEQNSWVSKQIGQSWCTEDGLPADGAGVVFREPAVNAVDVEFVGAG